MKMITPIPSLVAQFPTLLQPLLSFFHVLVEIMEAISKQEPFKLANIEKKIEDAADILVCATISIILVTLQIDIERVEVNGILYKRMKEPSQGIYFARRGEVWVNRYLYRQVGVRNGPTIVPLELRAGIVEGRWPPQAAMAAAHLLQDEPTRDAVRTCAALGVLPYSRSALGGIGEKLGQRWEDRRIEGEDILANNLTVPKEATFVSVSVDRVSLPMVEEVLDEDEKPKINDKGRVCTEVNYRMAYCGVWTLHDQDGKPLLSTRYGRMPHEGHAPIEETLRGDLEAIFTEKPDIKAVGLADGAPEMQNILTRVFAAVGVLNAMVGVDFWHLIEKLSDAARAADHQPSDVLPSFKDALTKDPLGIEKVESTLKNWCSDDKEKDSPDALKAALTYITNHRERMRYHSMLSQGFPIGSGCVEATCKTLVSVRMKRSGASWKTPGGQSVLNLRSLAKSSRWEKAMKFLMSTYVIEVKGFTRWEEADLVEGGNQQTEAKVA